MEFKPVHYIIYFIISSLIIIFACIISSFDYYVGGIAENSCYVISGAFSFESFFMLLFGCILLGYSIKGLSDDFFG